MSTNAEVQALCAHLTSHFHDLCKDAVLNESCSENRWRGSHGVMWFKSEFEVDDIILQITTQPTQVDTIEFSISLREQGTGHALKALKECATKWLPSHSITDRAGWHGIDAQVLPRTKHTLPVFRFLGSFAERINQMTMKRSAAVPRKSYEDVVSMSKSNLDKFVTNEISLRDGSSTNPLGGESDDVNPLSVIRYGFKVIHSTNWYDVVAWKDREIVAVIYRKKNRHYPSMLYLAAPPSRYGTILNVASALLKV